MSVRDQHSFAPQPVNPALLATGSGDAKVSDPVRRALLPDMLRRHAARTPDHDAVILRDADGGRRALTYAELDAVVNRVAMSWHGRGIGRGHVVAAIERNTPELLVAFYAASRCGATFNSLNPTYTASELAYQVDHARPSLVVVGDELRTRIEQLSAFGGVVPPVEVTSSTLFRAPADLTSGHRHEPEVAAEETDVALLVYTSGTESRPKGVMLTHRGFMLGTTPSWVLDGYLRPWDRFMLLAPMYTAAGIGTAINTISVGGTIVLVEHAEAELALRVIHEERITNMSQTPTFYRRLVSSPNFDRMDLGSVQQCHTYGGLTQASVFERVSSRLPDMVWATYWGQSELSQLGSIGWFRTISDVPRGDLRWIGRPVPHLDVRIVDDDDNDVEVGELIVRSPATMAGYLGDRDRTREVLGDGWLRTGDIVATDEHRNLYFFDRLKDMIKTGGMNVSSLEVEQAISLHSAIAEVAVVGVPHEEWSEAVTAFVVVNAGSSIDHDELRAHCRKSLAAYKVPKDIVVVDALPRDGQGKIRKRELRTDGGAVSQ